MPPTATALPLSTAARLAGVDKSTLRRAVKAGKLSAVRDEHGVWRIEACEVGRLYPLAAPGEQRPAADPEALPHHAPPAPAAVDALVAQLRETITDLRRERDDWKEQAMRDLRRERDDWKEQAMRLALPAPRPEKPTTWWRRLTG
jgi:hypothetical protein